MERFIPENKLSKKARRERDKARRNTWGALSPVTRKTENKKHYDRKKIRRDGMDACSAESFLFDSLILPVDKKVHLM